MSPTDRSRLLADDLMLDALGGRSYAGGDELGLLLASFAAHCDAPVSAPTRRRVRSYRALAALVAAGITVSGAGVAAALAPNSEPGRTVRSVVSAIVDGVQAVPLDPGPLLGAGPRAGHLAGRLLGAQGPGGRANVEGVSSTAGPSLGVPGRNPLGWPVTASGAQADRVAFAPLASGPAVAVLAYDVRLEDGTLALRARPVAGPVPVAAAHLGVHPPTATPAPAATRASTAHPKTRPAATNHKPAPAASTTPAASPAAPVNAAPAGGAGAGTAQDVAASGSPSKTGSSNPNAGGGNPNAGNPNAGGESTPKATSGPAATPSDTPAPPVADAASATDSTSATDPTPAPSSPPASVRAADATPAAPESRGQDVSHPSTAAAATSQAHGIPASVGADPARTSVSAASPTIGG